MTSGIAGHQHQHKLPEPNRDVSSRGLKNHIRSALSAARGGLNEICIKYGEVAEVACRYVNTMCLDTEDTDI